MASKGKSRWADSEEDAALEAKLKQEKEEKKRIKAEKARKAEAERAAEAARQQQLQRRQDENEDEQASGPPAKRRKITPETDSRPTNAPTTSGSVDGAKLLRFEGGTFGKARSVENYDKLNDIEEGAYGWVARAKELATGKVVALKRLKIEPTDRNGLPVTGLREIQILKDCQHRNVVKLQEVVVGEDTSKIEK